MVQCPAGKLAGFFMRFTIRDLLWATVVVALAVGWGIEYYRSPSRRLEHRARALEYALTQEGFTIEQPGPFQVWIKNGDLEYGHELSGPGALPTD
jgi:hypothetical protein